MKTYLIVIGKTDDQEIRAGIEKYSKRINHYHPFEMVIIPDIKKSKKTSEEIQKQLESEFIIKLAARFEKVILLDEKGKRQSSIKFAQTYQNYMISGIKNLAFVVGGPYGFSKEVLNKYPEKLSLSDFTFSHQLVRLLFLEQLYRINTIIKGEPYHHM